MSTMRWDAATLELPAVALTMPGVPVTTPAADQPVPAVEAAGAGVAGWTSRLRLPRPTAVLAPTLPALLLLGLCVAGLSDPPDQHVHGSGTVSRLHVPADDPAASPSVPLRR